jgi:hypothetical protein
MSAFVDCPLEDTSLFTIHLFSFICLVRPHFHFGHRVWFKFPVCNQESADCVEDEGKMSLLCLGGFLTLSLRLRETEKPDSTWILPSGREDDEWTMSGLSPSGPGCLG